MINQSRGKELHETGKKDPLRNAGITDTQRGSWIKGNIPEYSRINSLSLRIFMQNCVIKFLHTVLLVNRG